MGRKVHFAILLIVFFVLSSCAREVFMPTELSVNLLNVDAVYIMWTAGSVYEYAVTPETDEKLFYSFVEKFAGEYEYVRPFSGSNARDTYLVSFYDGEKLLYQMEIGVRTDTNSNIVYDGNEFTRDSWEMSVEELCEWMEPYTVRKNQYIHK